jgi:hypothetical protein
MYIRKEIDIMLLGQLTTLAESTVFEELTSSPSKIPPIPGHSESVPVAIAEIYEFTDSACKHLEPDLWDMRHFLQNHASDWY